MDIRERLKRERPSAVPYRRKTDRPYIFVSQRIRRPRGQQIYEFRMFLGLTRSALAKLMYVSLPSVVLWELGKIEPKELAWRSFCRVRHNYRLKMKRFGKDLDGGPVMGD
jgi:hypothetical protein